MNPSPELPFVLDGVRLEPRRPPPLPAIELLLMADQYPDQALAGADYHRLMAQPPYWAFCWGGGQALARWILDRPGQVAGRHVVDFGAGSGVAGVAAGRGGGGHGGGGGGSLGGGGGGYRSGCPAPVSAQCPSQRGDPDHCLW